MGWGDIWMTVGQASSRWSLITQFISGDLGWGHKLRTVTDSLPKHLIIFLLLHWVVGPFIFTLYMMFHLNIQDDNCDIQAYVTKPTLVITHVRMLHFTRQYKDTLQRKLTIFMSFRSTFIRVFAHFQYSNICQNYCKNKTVQFFASRSTWCTWLQYSYNRNWFTRHS